MSVEVCPHCERRLPLVGDAYCTFCHEFLAEQKGAGGDFQWRNRADQIDQDFGDSKVGPTGSASRSDSEYRNTNTIEFMDVDLGSLSYHGCLLTVVSSLAALVPTVVVVIAAGANPNLAKFVETVSDAGGGFILKLGIVALTFVSFGLSGLVFKTGMYILATRNVKLFKPRK